MNCAVIVDNRLDIAKKAIKEHSPFLKDWRIIHCKDSTVVNGPTYNELMTSFKFWEALVNYDRVLIFQHDSRILREGIEEFLEWDFIGAALYHIPFPCMNGGFSLRNPRAMLKCLNHKKYHPPNNEDIFYCQTLQEIGGKLPTKEIAMQFSVETIFGLGSLGWHQIDNYLTNVQCHQIRNQYLVSLEDD